MGKVQRVLGFCFGSDYIAPLSDRSTRGTRGTGAHMVIIKRKSNAPQIGTVGCGVNSGGKCLYLNPNISMFPKLLSC